MPEIKPFCTYAQQVILLQSRGMSIEDPDRAEHQLAALSYYRLSGYWHTMRFIHRVLVRPGSPPASWLSRTATKEQSESKPSCGCLRTRGPSVFLGRQVGAIDPLIHLDTAKLGFLAQKPARNNSTTTAHGVWLKKYNSALKTSKEDFVKHHQSCYDGKLPIWVAVEIMDWGMLSHLYRIAPRQARDEVASKLHLSAPQLASA